MTLSGDLQVEGRGQAAGAAASLGAGWSEEGHLANACKSASRLESTEVLSYYLSGGNILISSGPGLASHQLQGQVKRPTAPCPSCSAGICHPQEGQPRVSPGSCPWGTPSCRPQTLGHTPWGRMSCWLPPICFISLLPSPLHLPPSSPQGILAPICTIRPRPFSVPPPQVLTLIPTSFSPLSQG